MVHWDFAVSRSEENTSPNQLLSDCKFELKHCLHFSLKLIRSFL